MSKSSRMSSHPLELIGGDFKEGAEKLVNEDKQLSGAVQRTVTTLKQYQHREVRLFNDIAKFELSLNLLRDSNQGLTEAIAQKTVSNDETKNHIDIRENQNDNERKNTREDLQKKAAFYARLMIESQSEYSSIKLENDTNFYEKQLAVISSEVNKLIREIGALEKSATFSSSQEFAYVFDLNKLMKDEEEPMIREMRSKDNVQFMLTREIKQTKHEISYL
ncbi:uncharacterized protein [Fopius arisanus]|uniref:CROCC_0 protein n=1 Tax=Fopius arisanus TaxID=64838 RepID=A0A0C9RH98_9HYME|nr:PREDICTED: uncharacterized protein LOC105264459 [Fopius arisanus]